MPDLSAHSCLVLVLMIIHFLPTRSLIDAAKVEFYDSEFSQPSCEVGPVLSGVEGEVCHLARTQKVQRPLRSSQSSTWRRRSRRSYLVRGWTLALVRYPTELRPQQKRHHKVPSPVTYVWQNHRNKYIWRVNAIMFNASNITLSTKYCLRPLAKYILSSGYRGNES